MSYTKLANSILTSTIWVEDDHTRIVWVTLLALADRNGEVEGSIPGLASIARVPVESCRAAITKFLAPDHDSRTATDEGRRVECIDGGWLLINHGKYRERATDDHRKAKAAERQQRARERNKRNIGMISNLVTPASRQFPQAEAEAEADTKAKASTKAAAGRSAAPVQGVGASESGSLPRDHVKHAECGPRFLICLSPTQYAKFAPRFNGGTDKANRAGVASFLGYAEGLVGPNQSPGDFVWLLQHYDAWLASQGRIPAAPAKTTGKPQPRTAAQIIASMRAEGSL